ncbi:nSTAND3 domain-containing NTPase [Pedobacter hiemivivus]|uniref:Restriction endonuclease n=1 Tax=Pedobacter hiemivivus TaxID=2530454 RepID=A0A4V2MKM9_9SPHI|nr:restriction endonuclease [Pedobacter hiemivivus]TCC98826.1 restriction endonuclease [Pedobacter hiemivivus]
MSGYDFRSLSSYDFELLVRDLLQAELNISLQTFKPGRDGGVDIKGYTDHKKSIIVQCKHYVNSKFSSLYKVMKDDEVGNIAQLKPSQYYLVTSLPLNPLDKEKIFKLAPAEFSTTERIIDSNGVNNLLNKYPDIERRHFKLWLSSINILETILHSAIHNRSNARIRAINEKIKYYVTNENYYKASEILDKNHYLILSGIAGIGKSTLAEILVYQHLQAGFEFVEISENIEEAWTLFKPDVSQVFYYDDFLGKTSIADKLGKNEDKSILTFINEISQLKNKRFILTTREHLLQQARMQYQRLADKSLNIATCIVELGHYTKVIKAKILYNHLYFSDIPESFKLELIKGKTYKTIIEHANFNPRIIESMVNSVNLSDLSAQNYPAAFIKNLDHPYEIWHYAFNNQILTPSRYLLALLLTARENILLNELQELFLSSSKFNVRDFRNAIKELDGGFIKTIRDHRLPDELIIRFHNPSIVDFLNGHIHETHEFLDDLLMGAQSFQQLIRLWGNHFMEAGYIRKAILFNPANFIDALERLALFVKREGNITFWSSFDQRLLHLASVYLATKQERVKSLILAVSSKLHEHVTDFRELIIFLAHISENKIFDAEQYNVIWNNIKVAIVEESHNTPSIRAFTDVKDMVQTFQTAFAPEELEQLRFEFVAYDDYKTEFSKMNISRELESYFYLVKEVAEFWDVPVPYEEEFNSKMRFLQGEETKRDDRDYDELKHHRNEERYENLQSEGEIDNMFSADSFRID